MLFVVSDLCCFTCTRHEAELKADCSELSSTSMTPTPVPSESPLLLSIWEQPGAIAPSPSNSVAAASDDAGRQHVGTPSPPMAFIQCFEALSVVRWFGLVTLVTLVTLSSLFGNSPYSRTRIEAGTRHSTNQIVPGKRGRRSTRPVALGP